MGGRRHRWRAGKERQTQSSDEQTGQGNSWVFHRKAGGKTVKSTLRTGEIFTILQTGTSFQPRDAAEPIRQRRSSVEPPLARSQNLSA